MFDCCKLKLDPSEAIAVVMNNKDEWYMKRMIVRLLRMYANTTDNDIDNEVCDIIEEMLLRPKKYVDANDILIHFPQ